MKQHKPLRGEVATQKKVTREEKDQSAARTKQLREADIHNLPTKHHQAAEPRTVSVLMFNLVPCCFNQSTSCRISLKTKEELYAQKLYV